MIPESRIFDIAQACLDAVVAHYITEGVVLPDRQYVSNGLPAFDCEQVTVHVPETFGITGTPLGENPSDQYRDAGHAMRAGIFAVTIVRCVPTIDDNGQPPAVALEVTASQVIYADAVLSLNALIVAEGAGDLPGCGSVVFRSWTNENPQGGFGGGTLRVAISLAGL